MKHFYTIRHPILNHPKIMIVSQTFLFGTSNHQTLSVIFYRSLMKSSCSSNKPKMFDNRMMSLSHNAKYVYYLSFLSFCSYTFWIHPQPADLLLVVRSIALEYDMRIEESTYVAPTTQGAVKPSLYHLVYQLKHGVPEILNHATCQLLQNGEASFLLHLRHV